MSTSRDDHGAWLTVKEYARTYGFSEKTVRRWQAMGLVEVKVREDGRMLVRRTTPVFSRQAPPSLSGIYFLQCDRFIKIGLADNVVMRHKGLRSSWPYPIEPLAWIAAPASELKDRETALHQRFASCRHRGEWFHASAGLLAFIDQEGQPWPTNS